MSANMISVPTMIPTTLVQLLPSDADISDSNHRCKPLQHIQILPQLIPLLSLRILLEVRNIIQTLVLR